MVSCGDGHTNGYCHIQSPGQEGSSGKSTVPDRRYYRLRCPEHLSYVFPEWKYAQYFGRHLPQGRIPRGLPTVYRPGYSGYIPIKSTRGPIDLDGSFESEKYFQHCEGLVRSHFVPAPQIRSRVLQHLKSHARTVGVHVRLGDMIGRRRWKDLLRTDYYQRAMRDFPQHTFLVVSDTMGLVRKHLRGDNVVYVESGNPVIDLLVYAGCDHQIMSASTFSWWGAWLNDNPEKRIYVPAPWRAGAWDCEMVPARWIRQEYCSL